MDAAETLLWASEGVLADRWPGVHALTRIHPFVDGNGQKARLLTDLVFLDAQDEGAELFDRRLYNRRDIDLLREYDRHRDPNDLAAFIATQPSARSEPPVGVFRVGRFVPAQQVLSLARAVNARTHGRPVRSISGVHQSGVRRPR